MTAVVTDHYHAAFSAQATSRVSSSFTPAVGKLYVFGWLQTGTGVAQTPKITDGLGLTWTSIYVSPALFGAFGAKMALWETTITSAAAMTATLGTVENVGFDSALSVFGVTGSGPQIKSGQSAHQETVDGTTTWGTGSLPASATNGNLVLIVAGSNRDSFTAIPTPSGFTSVYSPTTGTYEAVGLWKSTTFTGTGVSGTSNGTDNESIGAVILEFEETGTPVNLYLLMEDGFMLLNEDGSHVLQME